MSPGARRRASEGDRLREWRGRCEAWGHLPAVRADTQMDCEPLPPANMESLEIAGHRQGPQADPFRRAACRCGEAG